MTTGREWTDLVRTRLIHWLGKSNASSWIMAGTLVVAIGGAAYLGAPPTHSAHTGSATVDPPASISADGQLARTNLQPPTTEAQLAHWAPFVFARTYQARSSIVLTENLQEVARSLNPAAMLRPWRWDFGDGSSAIGWTVHHAYGQPGTRRITVQAFFAGTKKWYSFDQANVMIAGPAVSKHV